MATETATQPIPAERAGTVTFDEFCIIIQPEQKADLLDGVICMASPEGTEASELFVWLQTVMKCYASSKKLGKIYGSRVAFRLGESYAPEPDIAFVRTSRAHLKRPSFFDGPPDLAVEIVSPGSVNRDYVANREVYRKAGVAEYWIIDESLRRTTLYRLEADGTYREVPPENGRMSSLVMDGFWIQTDWLWEDPEFDTLEIANTILADQRPHP